MLKFFSKIFGGSKSEKDVQRISPLVKQINDFFTSYRQLSNDELRGKTVEFKKRIQDYLLPLDEQIQKINSDADALPAEDINGKDDLYKEVDVLLKKRNEQIEEILKEILPEAFAVVKETARRFSENTEIVSKATQLDRDLSVKKDYIRIEGDNVIFKNSWTAAGGLVTWNMVHYDVQLDWWYCAA